MDRYANFAELAGVEKRGKDYRVRSRHRPAVWAVIAPHGGGIEPGTSELAEAVAGDEYSFYAFEGLRRRHNRRLHITSTHFDEPQGLKIVSAAEKALVIHGEGGPKSVVFLGGRDLAAQKHLQASLRRRGFRVRRHPNPMLHGADQENICNRCRTRAGVQVELSSGLRRSCFQSLSFAGRKVRTPRFAALIAALREGLHEER